MRAGAFALCLLSVPLNVDVLQALEEEPRSLIDLRRAAGFPPQTTMRGHLRTLTELGVLERKRQSGFPGSVDYELGKPGHDLLAVAEVLRTWLAESPGGAVGLGSTAARSAIKALAEGWSSAIVRALAAQPLALTELSRVITGISYPSLERRLVAMRHAGQIERRPGGGRGRPYAATAWLRQAMAPVLAAVLWERTHAAEEAPPFHRLDVEAAFLLALPLVSLGEEEAGVCRLVVETRSGGERRLAGAMLEVRGGAVVSCVSRLEGEASAWASGSTASWLRAINEGDTQQLEVGGDGHLAQGILDGLHGALFSAVQRV